MSVLINMDMPKNCSDCRFYDDNHDYPTCITTGYSRGYNWSPFNQRMPDCPLIEVPDFHYDLIDRSVLNLAIMDGDCGTEKELVKHILDCVNNAPAVVPAIKEADE